MSQLTQRLADIKYSQQREFGSKACNLAVIASEIRKTPLGFCLNSSAYINALHSAGVLKEIEELATEVQDKDLVLINEVSMKITNIIINLPIPSKVEAALKQSYQDLVQERDGFLVAVRSSATAEDLPSASFAGQLESYLNVDTFSEVLLAIKKCWASLWTPRAIHYRYHKRIGQQKIGMAVIVQEMIPAQVAGVMFTANPITSSRKEYYIEAVKGLGEGLVLGEKNADRYIVAKGELKITGKELLESEQYLDDFNIIALADEGRKLDLIYEEFQDVEWAFHKGKIYILQTRPITTLEDEEADRPPEEQMTPIQREVWTNVNERFPEPILPIDGIIVKLYYLSLFSAYSNLGFKVPPVDWHNVEKGLFPELFTPPAIKPKITRPLKYFELTNFDITREWKQNEELFGKYLDLLKKERLKEFPMEIIWEYLEDSLKDFQRALTFRYAIYIQYQTLYNTLTKILTILFGDEAKAIQQDLVSGHPQVTIEVNETLTNLAFEAKNYPGVFEIIDATPPEKIQSVLNESQDGLKYLAKFLEFIDKYGDRELSQGLGGLAVPTWREKPQVVWGMLKGILRSEINLIEQQKVVQERRERAEKRLEEVTSKGIGRMLRGRIYKLVEASKKYNAFREDSHFYLTQAMTVFKQMFLTIGDKLAVRGLLDDAQDIMYLNYFELREVVVAINNHQKVSKLEVSEKIIFRKDKQQKRRRKWLMRNIEVEADAEGILKGIGAASGKVTGVCRIITDPNDLARLRPGDILVAQYTNPAWTPVFSFIEGLVVEYGSTVSHAAIIAREYGLPAVMGIKGITQILKDGDTITIDGSRGLIKLINK